MWLIASSTFATTRIAMQSRRYSSYQSCSVADPTFSPLAMLRDLPSPRTSTPASISFFTIRGTYSAAICSCTSSFEREHGCVNRNVWPRFVDNAYHAQRHAHFANAQTIRPRPLGKRFANRIGECRNVSHAARHIVDSLLSELQTVAHRAFEPGA